VKGLWNCVKEKTMKDWLYELVHKFGWVWVLAAILGIIVGVLTK